MREFGFDSSCADSTAAFGRGLAGVLRGGDVVLLRGELGAGKTTLVRAVAQGLGVAPGLVSSPTFVVVNQYPARGGVEVVHVDAYRLGGAGELDSAGWDRFFDEAGHARDLVIVLVEWPERIEEAWASRDGHAEVRLEASGGPDRRRIVLRVPEAWAGRPGVEALLSRAPVRCAVTGRWVEPTAASYPFADARARMADLNKWFTGRYEISRPATEQDLDETR